MQKTKVAILGGGLGSLATAYWLSEMPYAAQRFEITVYQQGWRLGGKGASGRNLEPGHGLRIEEHGLHIWFGFYENAFATYKRVLAQLAALPNPPVQTFRHWRQAFKPHALVGLGDNGPEGLEQWPILFPRNGREPGCGQRPSEWGMFLESLRLGLNFFESRYGDEDEAEDFLAGLRLPRWAARLLHKGEESLQRRLLKVVNHLASLLPSDPLERCPGAEKLLIPLLEAFRRATRLALRRHVPQQLRARRIWIVTDLLTSVALGVLRDGLLTQGFETVDHLEFRNWLARHGADAEHTLPSNILRVLYDLMFAYANGREQTPNIAAGTGAKTLMLVFAGFDGAVMYKMQSGMGDSIFVPLYGLLKSRGVRFEFFHRVDKLVPGAGGDIDQVLLTRQATVSNGDYQPLLRVGAYDTWPATPLLAQLDQAAALASDPHNPGKPYDLESAWTAWPGVGARSLQRGSDYDVLVCGIPVGALGRIGAELIPRSPTWQRMLTGPAPVATVRTQAVQLWFARSCEELGHPPPPFMDEATREGLTAPLLGSYLQPLNTWCDMSQVLPQEAWPAGNSPRSISYFCGQMPDDPREAPTSDPGYPATQRAVVREIARRWLADASPVLWPKAMDPAQSYGLKPEVLVAPPGADAFAGQYFRANIDPGERYVLSLAGTTTSRPPVHGPDFPSLYLAGDWVLNPVLNAGCVEATMASGMAAARAISGNELPIAGERGRT